MPESLAASIVASAAQPPAAATELPAAEAPAKTEAKPAPAVSPDPKFAAAAAAEKKRREEIVTFKSERAKFEQERQTVTAEKAALEASKKELAEYREWKQKAKASPLDVMRALGIEYDAATAQKLNGGKPTTEQIVAPLTEKLTALEQRFADEKKAAEKTVSDQRTAEIAAVERQFDQACTSFVGKSEKHPLTRVREGASLVANVVREHWKQEEAIAEAEGRQPKMLSIEQAADLVESHFKKQRDAEDAALKPKEAPPAASKTTPPKQQEPQSIDAVPPSGSGASGGKRETPATRYDRVLKKYGVA